MKSIFPFIDLIISYLIADIFIRTFSSGWTKFIRNINANKILGRTENVLGRTWAKKKHGKLKAFRYERGANGQIKKVAA